MIKFNSEEEKKAWGAKMRELRLKNKLKKALSTESQLSSPSDKSNLPPPEPGYAWIRGKSGDILMLPQWLADDLIQRGDAENI